MRWFRALYRSALTLTPRTFRQRHGRDALRMASARVREETAARGAVRAARELLDLLLAIPAIRREFSTHRHDGGRETTPLMNTLTFEVRQAFRAIRRSKLTTAVAVLVLGLSMGISTAVFSVADRVLFRPLPYSHPDRLVELLFVATRIGGVSLSRAELNAARASNVLEQVEAYNMSGAVNRVDGPEPERLRVSYVTPGFLPMLGARLTGEGFTPEHAVGAGAPVAILTYDYWKGRLGGDPRVVGALLHLDGQPPVRILGVLDGSFVFPSTAPRSLLPDILRPLTEEQLGGDGRFARGIGRLRPGVPPEAVAAAVPVDPALRRREGMAIRARPLNETMVYSARRGLVMLFAGALVLLITGALDVSGLLVAQATAREREVVTMRALGAGTARIARQLLLEGLYIAIASGVLGLLVAALGFATLLQKVPPALQVLDRPALDHRALAFAAAVVAVTAVAFGLAPLLHLRKVSHAGIRAGATQTPTRSVRRVSGALVSGQIAGAVALASVGALLVSSFLRVTRVPLGLDIEKLAFVSVSLPRAMQPSRGDFYDEALRRIRTIEGVEGAALMDVPALRSTVRGTTLSPEGRSVPASDRLISDTQLVVTLDYFRTAGLRITEGRGFTVEDLPNASAVAIVNQTLARRWFPGESPIGRRLVNRAESKTIVGVVEDARHFALKEEPLEEVFLLMNPARPIFGATFVVRAPDSSAALPSVIAALRSLAPSMPITEAETGEAAVARAAMAERFYAALLAVIAGSALALATIGLYGTLSWSVGSRQREFGVRAALGADGPALAWTIVRQAIPLVAVGCAAGSLVGWWGARLASSLLYQVRPGEPGIWLGVAAIITVAAATAVGPPTRRAVRTSPADALRME